MPTFDISIETRGVVRYLVNAETEEEAIRMVNSGEVEYEVHEWEEDGEPYVDE